MAFTTSFKLTGIRLPVSVFGFEDGSNVFSRFHPFLLISFGYFFRFILFCIKIVWADGGYRGEDLINYVKQLWNWT